MLCTLKNNKTCEFIYLDGYIIKPQPVYNPWRDMLYQAKALMPNLWGWN